MERKRKRQDQRAWHIDRRQARKKRAEKETQREAERTEKRGARVSAGTQRFCRKETKDRAD